jgi:hypothetical protein
MTTPGGCSDIPAGSISGGTGASAYALSDFTPTCSGTDSLVKYWNDGNAAWISIPGLVDYSGTVGSGNGASNTDQNYGSTNTNNIVAITAAASGGYHAAARYCDKLSFGGYTDWFLPNRYELNLLISKGASIPGLDTNINVYYWSSTEANIASVWLIRSFDGFQSNVTKNASYRVRCMRKN